MRDYMKSFYNEDEEIQHAMLLKEAHTGRVQNIIRDLAVHRGVTGGPLFHELGEHTGMVGFLPFF